MLIVYNMLFWNMFTLWNNSFSLTSSCLLTVLFQWWALSAEFSTTAALASSFLSTGVNLDWSSQASESNRILQQFGMVRHDCFQQQKMVAHRSGRWRLGSTEDPVLGPSSHVYKGGKREKISRKKGRREGEGEGRERSSFLLKDTNPLISGPCS